MKCAKRISQSALSSPPRPHQPHHHHHHYHHHHGDHDQAKSKGRRSAPIDRTEAAFNVFDSDKEPDHHVLTDQNDHPSIIIIIEMIYLHKEPDHHVLTKKNFIIIIFKIIYLQDGYVTKQEFLRNTSKLSDEQVRLFDPKFWLLSVNGLSDYDGHTGRLF